MAIAVARLDVARFDSETVPGDILDCDDVRQHDMPGGSIQVMLDRFSRLDGLVFAVGRGIHCFPTYRTRTTSRAHTNVPSANTLDSH